ncbi:c-type cytochrome [Leucothrix pacifica]|uniref:Cytochrome C n=1 Tax=Leucothrix pacifica TaxID=1247513 RepID=A0A317CEM4_9GAMM|nr:cytochrome c [Leucothrix pacifica]PWQ97018.1 cytochrome C [Leucothrix pacifica]
MIISKKTAFVSTATFCVAIAASTIAFAASHSDGKAQEDAAEYRQSTFKMVGQHMGVMAAMMKGKVDFSVESFAKNAEAVAMLSQLAPNGFEVEGLSDDTDAKEEIWKDKDAFNEKMSDFQTTAAALAEATKSGEEGKIKAAFGPFAKTCKGCHTDYREK